MQCAAVVWYGSSAAGAVSMHGSVLAARGGAAGVANSVRGVSPTLLPSVCQVFGTAEGALLALPALAESLGVVLKRLTRCMA